MGARMLKVVQEKELGSEILDTLLFAILSFFLSIKGKATSLSLCLVCLCLCEKPNACGGIYFLYLLSDHTIQ
ncbi:hypothetical protein Hanom_Chr02g00153921 [Helianthus anomalus]